MAREAWAAIHSRSAPAVPTSPMISDGIFAYVLTGIILPPADAIAVTRARRVNMKQIMWTALVLTSLAIPTTAQEIGPNGQNGEQAKSSAGTSKQAPDDLDTFVRQYHARKLQKTATAACKDLKALGDAVDRLYESPTAKDVLDSIDRQFGEPPIQLSADGPDPSWDELINCANQTHSESQRAEALRVAAIWEQWRAEHLQNAYRDTLAKLPVTTLECKDLTQLAARTKAI